MDLITRAPRGTQDLLPEKSGNMRFIKEEILKIADAFGYFEIRTPVFEHTELFNRAAGETSDVVQKEMYTFEDKGGRSITLRPEGTAGAVRAFLEHGLHNGPLPQKLYYFSSCYRYEKPQAGRLREFYQFGIECFGAEDPSADAEVISFADSLFHNLGLENIELQINSIGCPECRKKYYAKLREYFNSNRERLCKTCLERLETNPLRILDCKNPECKAVAENAPMIIDYLCEDCETHFNRLKTYLDELKIEYAVNPTIVRGLDYYTRTVFEFVSKDIGAQGTVCGGGRYDGLVEELGGPKLPSLGFGLGLDRLMLVLEKQDFFSRIKTNPSCEIFIASMDQESKIEAVKLVRDLRLLGVSAQYDLGSRSLKAQSKYADKIGAEYFAALGGNELNSGEFMLKNMRGGESKLYKIDGFAKEFADADRQSADQ